MSVRERCDAIVCTGEVVETVPEQMKHSTYRNLYGALKGAFAHQDGIVERLP